MLEGSGLTSRAGHKGARRASLGLFVLVSLSARLAAGQSELPAAPVAERLFQQGKAALSAGGAADEKSALMPWRKCVQRLDEQVLAGAARPVHEHVTQARSDEG